MVAHTLTISNMVVLMVTIFEMVDLSVATPEIVALTMAISEVAGSTFRDDFHSSGGYNGDFRDHSAYSNNLHDNGVYSGDFMDNGGYFGARYDGDARNGGYRDHGLRSSGARSRSSYNFLKHDSSPYGYGNDDGSCGGDDYGGRGGHSNDERPPWDSFDRQRTAPRDPMRDAPHPPPNGYLDGSTWEYCIFKTHEDKDINLATGIIYPWTGHSPDLGKVIVNYPVRLNMQDMSWRGYLSDLLHGRYNPSDQKSIECFHKGFPMAKGSKLSMMDYLLKVVQHGKDWGLFIPPLHTIEVNNPLRFYLEHIRKTHQAQIPVI